MSRKLQRPRFGGRDLGDAEQYSAKAQRFRERVAGLRHALDNNRVAPLKRAESERMLRNLEAAIVELDRLAKR
jgi:hypothetical protein